MSVTVCGVTHHLVSYYSVEDVMRGVLNPPSMMDHLKLIRPRPELTTKQSFRAPIDDLDSHNMEESDPSQAVYGYRPMVGQGYGIPNPNYYPMPGASFVPHPPPPGVMSGYPPLPGHPPYLQNTAPASDVATKTEEYSSFRGPAGYATGYEPTTQPMPHLPSTMSRPPPTATANLYRTPSLPGRGEMPQSVDPNAAPTYQRSSFSVQGGIESGQALDQRNMNQPSFDASSRRDSSTAYYNGSDRQQPQPPQPPQSQQPPQQQQPPQPSPHQRHPSVAQPSQQQQSQQPPYYATGGQQSYQAGQQPLSSWGTSGSGQAQV